MIHKALITQITPSALHVRILDGAGCEACRLAGCCGGADGSPASSITVSCANTEVYRVGQTVTVETAPRMIEKAVVWAFILPLIILVGCIFAFSGSSDSTLGAAIGLVSMAAYFLVMRVVRRTLAKHLRWRLQDAI